jgi:hypothetical protein
MKNYVSMLAGALLLVVVSLSAVNAQSDGVKKSDFLLSPFIGGPYAYTAGGFTMGVIGEYAFTDEISGGGYLAYSRYDYGVANVHYSFIDFGVRASYHFAKLLKLSEKRFDPYAGASLGFVASSYNNDYANYNDPYNGGFRPGIYAGARWFFNEKVGVFGELGFAVSVISVGATFKF